jgi:peptidoglycan/LPS O-acetylase OafA/YrhL
MMFTSSGYREYFTLTVQSVGTLLVIPRLFALKTGHGITAAFFVLTSKLSYSMYLINMTPVQLIFLPFVFAHLHLDLLPSGAQEPLRFVLYWVSTFAFSYLIYHYFEVPIMNLRDLIGRRVRNPRLELVNASHPS